MKTTLLTLISIFVLTDLYAQKIELSVQANTGAYHYSGASATATSFFNPAGGDGTKYYTNNAYGSKAGFGYGGAVQAQFVSKGGFIAGLQAGYDILRSNETINAVYPPVYFLEYLPAGYPNYAIISAKGNTHLTSQDINLSPYIGYRVKLKKIRLDLMPGMDVAFNLSAYDKGTAKAEDGTNYKTDYKQTDLPVDVRLKFGVAAGYKKWAITAGYAHGLTNLEKNVIADGYSGGFVVHSELLRFGLSYVL